MAIQEEFFEKAREIYKDKICGQKKVTYYEKYFHGGA